MKLPARVDWKTILLMVGMYAMLLVNFWLYQTRPLPLALHILFAAAAIHCAFTIWHEAVHNNVSDEAWFNNLVGIVGMLPYMTPYFIQKWIHLKHHAKLNQPDDPNQIYVSGPFWQIPFRYFRGIFYVKKVLKEDRLTLKERMWDTISVVLVASIYFNAWIYGFLKEVVLLWLVPVILAKVILDWYINYIPHVGLPDDNYKGTRIIDLPWFAPFVLNHNYHAVHHLWPRYPWHQYVGVFRKSIEKLKKYGVPIERRIFGFKPEKEKEFQPV